MATAEVYGKENISNKPNSIRITNTRIREMTGIKVTFRYSMSNDGRRRLKIGCQLSENGRAHQLKRWQVEIVEIGLDRWREKYFYSRTAPTRFIFERYLSQIKYDVRV